METRSSRNKVEPKKIKRKKLNIARTLVFVLFIYLLVCIGSYIYKEPVRHYEIKGNNYISDREILEILELKDYPPMLSINLKKLQYKLEKHELVKSAKVRYKWGFYIEIEIEENKPLFVIKSENKTLLSDGEYVDTHYDYLPILLNNTPKNVLSVFVENFSEVKDGIMSMISEIEYQPSYSSENEIIDDSRFLLYMSDGNLVYITAKNAKLLNNYLNILATSQITGQGTLYLDGDESRYPFILFS